MRDYFVTLNVTGNGAIALSLGPPESYLDGAAYADGQPLDAQLALNLTYDRMLFVLGFAGQTIEWMRVSLIAIAMLVLPGWTLATMAWRPFRALTWTVQLGLAIGVSAALYPLLALLSLAGVRVGPAGVWGLVALGLGGLIWNVWAKLKTDGCAHRRVSFVQSVTPADLATCIMIAAVGFTRFLAIGTLDVPMWGDSYQHTMMAQLIADHRGLFDSWLPYAELTSFTYHYGFHALVANFHWLSGMAMPKATLWMGQILNVAAVVALSPLTGRMSRNRWAIPITLLVAGLISSMPMFYLNWGRYTQLAGQVMLPVAIFLLWASLDDTASGRERDRIGLIALGIIAMSGLALTHYRVLIFAVLFLPAYVLLNLRDILRNMRPAQQGAHWQVPPGVLNAIVIGIGCGLLFLPQFVRTFEGHITAGLAQKLTTPAPAVSEYLQQYNAIGDPTTYLPATIWLLMSLAFLAALWQHNRSVVVFTAWWGLIILAANPSWLSLPGTGVLSNFAVFIAAYIPAGVLIGSLANLPWFTLARRLAPPIQRVTQIGVMLIVIGWCVWSTPRRLGDVNVKLGALVTRPDILAANWVREHTPESARLLVNTFPAYGNTSVVGSDGGWWLPLLANRLTNLPPLTYSAERGPTPDYLQRVNALSHRVNEHGLHDQEVWQMLREHGITHVYVGQRQGRVNNPGGPALDVEQLLSHPRLKPVYHQDRVWIFEVQP